jgi:hypothetical protein
VRNSVYPAISRNDNHWRGLVPRMLRSAVSAFTRVFDALCLAAWCAADPGPIAAPWKYWVPALRSSAKCAPRPGHDASREAVARPYNFRREQSDDLTGLGGNQCAGASGAAQGTRASANTSGPDFTWAKIAGEIADLKIRTERRKLCFFCRTGFRESELFRKCDPAV